MYQISIISPTDIKNYSFLGIYQEESLKLSDHLLKFVENRVHCITVQICTKLSVDAKALKFSIKRVCS